MSTDVSDSEALHLLTGVGLGRGMNVVEFGAGSGSFCRLLSVAVGPQGRVLGLDQSAFSVARARELAAQERLENVVFEVADLGDTHLASDCADFCLARQVLGHVSLPERVIGEMTRIVKPGGVVALSEGDDGLVVYEPEPPSLAELRDLLVRDRLSSGGSHVRGRSLHRLLCQAGLTGVRVEALTSNSTEPEWSATRDPVSYTFTLGRAIERLADKGSISEDDAARYGRALEETIRNPHGFVFVCRFFAYGRRPLRCA